MQKGQYTNICRSCSKKSIQYINQCEWCNSVYCEDCYNSKKNVEYKMVKTNHKIDCFNCSATSPTMTFSCTLDCHKQLINNNNDNVNIQCTVNYMLIICLLCGASTATTLNENMIKLYSWQILSEANKMRINLMKNKLYDSIDCLPKDIINITVEYCYDNIKLTLPIK